MYYLKNIFLTALLITLLPIMSYAELTTAEIAKNSLPSVVTIIALDENDQPLGLGSGFFINRDGDVATNHHVLEGSSKAIIKTLQGDKGNVLEIIKADPELDLLVAKTSLKNTKPLPLGDSDTVIVGEDIIAIGNSAGSEGTVSKGITSGIGKADDYKFFQITAPISPGNSGGPVFNLSGKVIAVATAGHAEGQYLNFAVPINYIMELAKKKILLGFLPRKSRADSFFKDYSLVQIFDVHKTYNNDYLKLNFTVKNDSRYAIGNIKLFFIYKNHKGKVISYAAKKMNDFILPQLAQQYKHVHRVKYLSTWVDKTGNPVSFEPEKVMSGEIQYAEGNVDIRILDYEIDRTASSPADLLFK
jgi:hypothetical protein